LTVSKKKSMEHVGVHIVDSCISNHYLIVLIFRYFGFVKKITPSIVTRSPAVIFLAHLCQRSLLVAVGLAAKMCFVIMQFRNEILIRPINKQICRVKSFNEGCVEKIKL
jgi:hypothetical protein